MVAKLCVRFSPKTFALCAIAITVILCIYYASYVTDVRQNVNQTGERRAAEIVELPSVEEMEKTVKVVKQKRLQYEGVCPVLGPAEADINTVDIFKEFDFQ
ncbi:hypothetical protein ILUMI_02399, partial [Ignelater luminosus]